MSAKRVSSNFLITLGAMVSIAIAGAYSDLQFNSNDFMFDDEVSLTEDFEGDRYNREVASAERELPAAQYIAMNLDNKNKINGHWEITRIYYNTNESALFDKSRDSYKIEVTLEMIGTSYVRLDGDTGLEFDISLMHESGQRLALFRTIEDGHYEIIEAKKVNKKESSHLALKVEENIGREKVSSDKIISSKRGVILEDAELELERALDPNNNKEIIMGDEVNGSMSISGGDVSNFEVTLHSGTDKEFTISEPFIKINNGGQFNFEYEGDAGVVEISGIITNNGKDGYRMRFVSSGILAGAMLNFVTDDEFLRLSELQENIEFEKLNTQADSMDTLEDEADLDQDSSSPRENKYEKRGSPFRKKKRQEERIEDRWDDLSEEEYEEEEEGEYEENEEEEGEHEENEDEPATEEEMSMQVKKSGFHFAKGKPVRLKLPSRSIASEVR